MNPTRRTVSQMFTRTETAQLLLSNCINKDCDESDHDSFPRSIKTLIEQEGVSSFNNLKDGRGYTLLHIAVECANENHVTILLDKHMEINDPNIDYVNARNSQYETPLHIASERGLVEIAKLLLKTGKVKVNAMDAEDWTSLHRAVYHNNKDMVELLLGCEGIDVNKVAENSDKWTPLHAAAKTGNKEIVPMLLKAGAHKSMEVIEARRGDRPLTLAAFNGCYDMCQILLEHGADHRAVDKSGWSSLHKAAYNKHHSIVELLLLKDSSPEHINYASTQDGFTPLFCAVSVSGNDNDLVIELLLEHTVTASINLEAKGKRRGDTVLLMAAYNCADKIVKKLLEKGSDPTAVDNDGWSALHKCCYKGKNVELVQFFLDIFIEKGLDVNACAPRDLWSPLHCAAVSGNHEIVQKLLDNGAMPALEMKDRHRHDTPLLLAAFRGNQEVIRTLLKNNASLEAQDKDGWTALLKACYSKKCLAATVDLLLEKGAVVTHKARSDGYTALHAAAQNDNSLEVMKLLVNKKAVIDAKETLRGNTPLLYAAYNGFIDSVNYLIQQGADINSTDKEGWGAVHKAAYRGFEKVVELLLMHGANLNVVSGSDQWRPLHCAARSGKIDMVNLLLKKKVQLDVKSQDGNAPLLMAAFNGQVLIVEALLKANADINAQDKDGWNALMKASLQGYANVATALLDFKGSSSRQCADVNAIAHSDGWTALHAAAKRGDKETIQLLIDREADLTAKDKNRGDTPLMVASFSAHLEAVKTFLSKGADWKATDDFKNWTALHKVCISVAGDEEEGKEKERRIKNRVEIVKLLLEYDVEEEKNIVNAKGSDGWTPLHCCAFKGNTAQLELLVNSKHKDKVQLEIQTEKDGFTPLILAAAKSRIEAVWLLINSGANRCAVSYANKSTFDFLDSKEEQLRFALDDEIRPFSYEELNGQGRKLWFQIIQVDNVFVGDRGSSNDLKAQEQKADEWEVSYNRLIKVVEKIVGQYPELASAIDSNGRAALDVASKPMKTILQTVLLWHGRYRIIEARAEHTSATCYVFKAIDEHDIDKETNQPRKVALKLMRRRDQFNRELAARESQFNSDYVMDVLRTHPSEEQKNGWPEVAADILADPTSGTLKKADAEKFFLLVMPLADRNLFVALKQERWAGKNMEEVRHVFMQLVKCVDHMHEKGALHADIKPLNIVRTAGHWKLIDLDASCAIAGDFADSYVGYKSSSAYAPPEAIYVDEDNAIACVRTVNAIHLVETATLPWELLNAKPSFDVWSLGCILYQMCTDDVRPLFQGGQDDSLTDNMREEDNLFALAEWDSEYKDKKLSRIADRLARNLLGQMLQKDPTKRPKLTRVLAHPFLSNKKVARMVGEQAKFDVFISYRVDSEAAFAEKLYNALTAQGFKVWWDKVCLEAGVNWEDGFCAGLVSSKAFVPLLSRKGINNPDRDWQNFSKLTADSRCDNVFLEHRLAGELHELGLIELMFPIFIADLDDATNEYGKYFATGCHPVLVDVCVEEVEKKLQDHMEIQALGTPLTPNNTVKNVVTAITSCQGAFIEGPAEDTFKEAIDKIAEMLTKKKKLTIDTNASGKPSSAMTPKGSLHQLQILLTAEKDRTTTLTNIIHAAMNVLDQSSRVVGDKEAYIRQIDQVKQLLQEEAREVRVLSRSDKARAEEEKKKTASHPHADEEKISYSDR